MEKKVVVGVIGCGCIANAAHIPSYMNNPDVVIKHISATLFRREPSKPSASTAAASP